MNKTYITPAIKLLAFESSPILVRTSIYPGSTIHDEGSQHDWEEGETDHGNDVPGAIDRGWQTGDPDDAASKPSFWD